MLMVSVRVVEEEEDDVSDLTQQLAVLQANDPTMAATHYSSSGQQQLASEHTMAPNRTDQLQQQLLEDDMVASNVTMYHDSSSSS